MGKKYVKVSNNVRVSVIPIYLGQGFIRDRRISGESFSRNDFIKSRYYWQYHITIENLSNEPLELIERLWYIYEDNENEEGESSEGSLKRVAGRELSENIRFCSTKRSLSSTHQH